MVTAALKSEDNCFLEDNCFIESDDKPRQRLEKQRHFSADKGLYRQGHGLPSGHIRFKSWTIKKVEHQRIYTFKLWCWRRLLKVPWTAKRSNQSTLKETNPEYSLEGLMLKLKLHILII